MTNLVWRDPGGIRVQIDNEPYSLDQVLRDLQRAAIKQALDLEDGNRAAAARRLGMKRTTLVMKIGKLIPEVMGKTT